MSANLLFIMSDQHNRKVMGCSDHPCVETPNLDRLAAGGTRFTNAYTHSPLCVPARASFATGRYLHDIGNWDNASPYDGSVPSWGHRLAARGHHTVSIGKLHYRSADDANGFEEETIPLHVVEGIGDVYGCLRDELPLRPKQRQVIEAAGRGESSYTGYDDDITARTIAWLEREAPAHTDRPFALFCSMVCPHPPLKAPARHYDRYPLDRVPWPAQATAAEGWDMHPAIDELRTSFGWSDGLSEESIRRAVAAYLGLVSFLDENIGRVLDALERTGLAASTRVIYTSDHGDNHGNHGLFNKNTLYEDAAGVPLIMSGPGIAAGRVVDTPVTHLDCFPTILEAVGCDPTPEDRELPGTSLFELAGGGARARPILLSQYHGSGSRTGSFLVRDGKYKYVHYVAYRPQLFDLEADPHETVDLSGDPTHAAVLERCREALHAVCDPVAIDAAAHRDQRAKIEAFGGREAVLARGSFGPSPVPGERAQFVTTNGAAVADR